MVDCASILIVEQDSTLRARLAQAMRARGIEALVACDHVDALALITARRPNMLVVDLSAVQQVGLAIVAMIHAIDPSIEILIWTIYSRVAHAVDTLGSRKVRYLPKPADADDILQMFAIADRSRSAS